MAPLGLSAFIKYLVGAFLLQGATLLLVIATLDAGLQKSGWLVVALGILIGVIAALWFSAISSHASQHAFARASEKFNRQRDRIRRRPSNPSPAAVRPTQRGSQDRLLVGATGDERQKYHNNTFGKMVTHPKLLKVIRHTLQFTRSVNIHSYSTVV